MPAEEYASEESTTASVPATPHQPPLGWRPARTATPRNPSPTPAMRAAPTCSCGRKRVASRNVKIGTVDCAMPGDARVDVLLAPGDEPERDRRVQRAEHERGPPVLCHLCDRAAPSHRDHEVRGEDHRGSERPHGHHRAGLDVLHGDLDEEVRRAPDRREQEQHRPVPRHRPRLTRRPRPDLRVTVGHRG